MKSKKFKEADEETRRIIYLLSEDANRGSINPETFSKILCEDINIIDELWRNHSNNKFGFNAQEEVWRELQGDRMQFAEKVGWYKNNKWVKVSELNYSLQAPKGHLPSRSPVSTKLSLSGGWIIISLLNSSKSSCLLKN